MTKLRYENIDRERIRVFADDGPDRVTVGEITVHQYMRLRGGGRLLGAERGFSASAGDRELMARIVDLINAFDVPPDAATEPTLAEWLGGIDWTGPEADIRSGLINIWFYRHPDLWRGPNLPTADAWANEMIAQHNDKPEGISLLNDNNI